MDILRRIFGLTPAPASEESSPGQQRQSPSPSPSTMEGPTMPLSGRKSPSASVSTMPAGSANGSPPQVDLGSTNILEDTGDTQKLYEQDYESVQTGRRIAFGIKSDVGQIRSNNQDAALSILSSTAMVNDPPEFGIFVVADGMGGHLEGEKASSIAARTVGTYGYSEIYLPMLRQEEAHGDRPTITEILRNAFQQANQEVSRVVPDGGTTCTTAVIIGDLAYIAHVGDSRAYIINEDGIEQLTRDHSLVQRLIELEQLTQDEAADHPQKNVLYRALGQNDVIDVDAITRRLTPGSRLIVCSDGLWNHVPNEEMRNTVSSSPNPQTACETLVKLANSRGGTDNITVVIIKMPE